MDSKTESIFSESKQFTESSPTDSQTHNQDSHKPNSKTSAESKRDLESRVFIESTPTDSEFKTLTEPTTSKNLNKALSNINNGCISASRAESKDSKALDSAIFAIALRPCATAPHYFIWQSLAQSFLKLQIL
ncbi:hypothetical protein [uncultured Helicobacter sp.]|uniref:hypothetical protein n=1 Tax=uncultured Helicobacter sp. TaxID=175537 RepID=UPI00375217F7